MTRFIPRFHLFVRSCVAVTLFYSTAVSAQVVTDRNRADALRHYRAGEKALRSEAYAEAEKAFQSAVKLDPVLDLAHYGLGQVYMSTKRFPDAVRAFVKCREAFYTAATAAMQDHTAFERRLDDHIRALEDQLNSLQMGRARTSNTAATILRLDGQIKGLQHQRQRGPERPETTPAWISLALGSAYFRTSALPDAEREYREALKSEPNLGEAHNNLAVVCMLSGRYDEAEREVAAAEKAGFKVNPQFKQDLKARSGK